MVIGSNFHRAFLCPQFGLKVRTSLVWFVIFPRLCFTSQYSDTLVTTIVICHFDIQMLLGQAHSIVLFYTLTTVSPPSQSCFESLKCHLLVSVQIKGLATPFSCHFHKLWLSEIVRSS